MNNNAMTAVIRYGICRSLIVQDSEGNGAAQHKITGGLSMAYFGFYTQEHMAGLPPCYGKWGTVYQHFRR